jgi:hypothetical protein
MLHGPMCGVRRRLACGGVPTHRRLARRTAALRREVARQRGLMAGLFTIDSSASARTRRWVPRLALPVFASLTTLNSFTDFSSPRLPRRSDASLGVDHQGSRIRSRTGYPSLRAILRQRGSMDSPSSASRGRIAAGEAVLSGSCDPTRSGPALASDPRPLELHPAPLSARGPLHRMPHSCPTRSRSGSFEDAGSAAINIELHRPRLGAKARVADHRGRHDISPGLVAPMRASSLELGH